MTQLTAHFTLEELTRSQAASRLGLDNTPSPAVAAQLLRTAQRMEIVRSILGNRSIFIDSGYRSAEVNKAIGGVSNSAHVLGYAVDFVCPDFGSPFDIAQALDGHRDDLRFDQLIFEFRDWVHISFAPAERRQALTIFSAAEGYLSGVIKESPARSAA